MKKTAHLKLRALCEGAVMVALAQILGYVKFFSLPNGGSVTVNMLPIFIYCARWGFGPGMLASFSLSLLQLLLDGAYAWGWQSIIGDYIVAYSLIGVAGLFKKLPGGFFIGSAAGALARFLAAWYVGAVVWGEYMPESFFGMTMSSPWIYSALYNGSYLALNTALCLLIGALLWKPMGRFIRGEDLV